MVKLQKRFAYKYKDKNHYKHIVTIPDEFVEKLGWKSDIELEPVLEKDKLILRAKKKNE
jgi:bifunctional DNA-binding transcriptional regulator/antitoxin component of YhaV-PrlF toxin-antitoxin module